MHQTTVVLPCPVSFQWGIYVHGDQVRTAVMAAVRGRFSCGKQKRKNSSLQYFLRERAIGSVTNNTVSCLHLQSIQQHRCWCSIDGMNMKRSKCTVCAWVRFRRDFEGFAEVFDDDVDKKNTWRKSPKIGNHRNKKGAVFWVSRKFARDWCRTEAKMANNS